MRFVIDKSAVNKNAAKIVDLADKSQVIGVVKANGYGLGTVEFAKILIQNGIDFLAVSSLGQAEALRKADINEDILLLTPVATVKDAEEAVMLNLTATVDSAYSAELLNSVAIKNSATVKAHIKIDTGFGRYGFLPGEETKIKEVILKSNNIEFTGIYSHFSSAFVKKSKYVDRQFDTFKQMTEKLEDAGIDCGKRHIANSSAFFQYPSTRLDAVRIGSAFLGRLAVPNFVGLEKIGYLECEITAVKILPKKHNIGYGNTYKTKKASKIAVVPLGHIHGYYTESRRDCYRVRDIVRYILNDLKLLKSGNKEYCTINGKSVPVIGRVGLTHTVLDVSGIECTPGDKAVFEINPLRLDSSVERIFV